MSLAVLEDASELIAAASALYEDDPQAREVLADLDRRLHEPLRLALAGMVKAGKSTLLNAILGEQIAPTDAGECTRVVTWYRYSDTPSVTLHLKDGQARRLPVKRDKGHLVLTLGGVAPEEAEWIDVGWPSAGLRDVILIDTPGIASISQSTSARSTTFLTPEDAPSSADAIVYLLRHLHASDLKFLEAFRDTAAGASQTVNALAVLSRADEVGSGRIDSMLSAGKVARRYEGDGDLASLVLGVVPVAGLLAEGARTLREKEFAEFRELASLDRSARNSLLVSADRFARSSSVTTISEKSRKNLLARFGIFGVRLATTLVRGGVSDSTELVSRLVQHSGLNELTTFIDDQFRSRVDALKVRGVLSGIERVLRDAPREGDQAIAAGIERINATAHTMRELSLLSRARQGGLPLPEAASLEAQRIIGGDGAADRARVGLGEEATNDDLRARVDELVAKWRTLAQSPLTERAGAEVCRVVIRSLEEIASHLSALGPGGTAAHVDPAGGPAQRRGHSADEQGEEDEDRLDGQELAQNLTVTARRDQL